MSQPLEIVFHPAKGHPVKAALLAFGLGIAFQAVWQALEPLTAIVMAVVILATVRDFYLETRYRFDDDGLSISGLLKPARRYPWRRFRAFVEDRNGVFLTPYHARRRLEQQRGVFLALERADRKRAVELLEQRDLSRRAS